MQEDRLELVAPDVSAKLREADDRDRREAALAACRFALERNPTNDPIISGAIQEIESGHPVSALLRTTLEKLVESLDEEYFDLQEAGREGRIPPEAYLPAFYAARTANAVYCATSPHSLNAATESVYEANAATEDLDGLRARVLAVLKR